VRVARFRGFARLILLGTLVAGCSAIGGNGTNGQTNRRELPAQLVTVAKVTSGPISQTAQYTGTVQPFDTVNVVPQISGQIVKLDADVGSKVKKGDVIAELDKTTLQEQEIQAEAGVEAAQVKLAAIKAQGRPESIAQAQANLDSAKAKLAADQAEGRPESVAQAKANLDAAKAKLAAIKAGSRPETVAVAKANLDAAKAKLQQLLDGPTPDQVAAAKLQLEQAKDALNAVQANKDGQCNPRNPSYQCEAAQAQALSAETAVNVAAQNLKTLTDPPTQDAINQAQAAVDAAQQQYQLAQTPYTSNDIAQAQAAVDAAQQQYDLAKKPFTSNDIAQAQAAVDAATAQLALAKTPYTDLDLQSAQVALKQAQALLTIAQTNLKNADVVAPFDGVISAKLLSPGALATPQTPIFTLIADQSQVQFSIEQSRIDNVKVGQTVNLTTNAFPGKTFPAKVTSVYPSADPKTHTFTVVVVPQNGSTDLRSGMFVNLSLTIASAQNATLVPNVAITQRGPQSIVFVVTDGKVRLQPVTLGIADDKNTQIENGVKVGDTVVTSGQANHNDGSPVRVAGQPPAGGASARPGGQSAGSQRPAASGQRRAAGATPSPTK
jgi:HlyD family secretion protein